MKTGFDRPTVVIDGQEVTLHKLDHFGEVNWEDILIYHNEGSITDEELKRVEHFFDHETGEIKPEYLRAEIYR